MAFDLKSISTDSVVRAPRVICLGVEKIGKSTFAAGANNPIFIPIRGEEGIDALEVAKFPTCRTLADVQECLTTLYLDAHEYQTVVIDSASALEPLVHDQVTANAKVKSIEEVGGGYGKGYVEATNLWRIHITQPLDFLRNDKGMAVILIGHVKIRRFDDPVGNSYDQYQFDIHEKAANLLYRWADLILFCNTKTVTIKERGSFGKEVSHGVDIGRGQRFLYTQKTPAHPGGGRGVFGHLPYELPLSWGNFQDAVAATITK